MSFLRRNILWLLTGLGLLILVGLVLSVVQSLPPNHFIVLTGREGGAYYTTALEYQKIAKQLGYDLIIQPTAGSVETLQLLEEGKADVGFVQGGIGLEGDPSKLSTLASVFYEPVWILYRRALAPDQPLEELGDLQGLRINVGEAGSGTNQLARQLLEDVGIDGDTATLAELSSQDAAQGLRDGTLDAAFFVVAPSSQLIQELTADPALELMSLRRADAFARRHRFLTVLTIPEGTVNMVKNIPRNDVEILSTVANLVVRSDFHPDLVRLMTVAAVRTHENGTIFAQRFEFPNLQYADLPVGTEELAYLNRIKSGESTFDNYLPFWAAALLDRYLLFVVPLLLIFRPMLGRSPLVYQWFTRYRITRWYKQVRSAELRVDTTSSIDIDEEIRKLRELDDKLVVELSVGNSYMPEVYNLRSNIEFVIKKLERRKQEMRGGVVDDAEANDVEANDVEVNDAEVNGAPVDADASAVPANGQPAPLASETPRN